MDELSVCRLALITGCFGFLGGHVVEHLVQSGWSVVGIGHGSRDLPLARAVEGDITFEAVRALIEQVGKPELVIHCASRPNTAAVQAEPYPTFLASLEALAGVIEAVRACAPEAVLIYPSSTDVYQAGERAQIESQLAPVLSSYATHQLIYEEFVRSAARDLGLTTRVVRLFPFYGEGIAHGPVWDLCVSIAGGPLQLDLKGSAQDRYDLFHLRDAMRLIERLADPALGPFVLVNGGTGVATSLHEIAQTLIRACGRLITIQPSLANPPTAQGMIADTTQLHQLTGFQPETGRDEGIAAYARWAFAKLGACSVGDTLDTVPDARFTIIIDPCRHVDDLPDLLDSIQAHTCCPHQIVVCVRGSTDGTVAMLQARQQANLMVVEATGQPGGASALNDILTRIKTPFFCVLSVSDLINGDVLDQAVAILENQASIGMVGFKVKDLAGPQATMPYVGDLGLAGLFAVEHGMLPIALLRQLGGFDEELPDAAIGLDLTLRVLKAGHEVVLTRQVALLRQQASSSGEELTDPQRPTEQNMQIRSLLAVKHADLGVRLSAWKRKLLLWKAIRAIPVLRGRLAINAQDRVLGHLPCDLHHAFNARWVSSLDPWQTRHSPYHMVQRMSEPLARR